MSRPRLVPTLLALSLVLNLCIAGGYAYNSWIAPNRPARQDAALFRELGFDAAQQRAFLVFRRTVGMDARAMRQKVRPLSAAIWQGYGDETPDAARIQGLIGELIGARLEFQKSASTALIAFLAQMRPEQRRDVIDKLEHRSPEMRTGFPAN